MNIHVDRGTYHGRHDRYSGRHAGRYNHRYYGHHGYFPQTSGYLLSRLYHPSYATSYYCYGWPYYQMNRGWSVGINLGGLNSGYSRYKYDYGYNYYGYNYGYGCRFDDYFPSYYPSYYPSYSYTPYRYGYRGYGLTNYSSVYYPASTEVYTEPVVDELDYYYDEDDEDDPFDDVGYGWLDYSSYDYLYEWPVWRWYSTSTSVPLVGLGYYRTCGPY